MNRTRLAPYQKQPVAVYKHVYVNGIKIKQRKESEGIVGHI